MYADDRLVSCARMYVCEPCLRRKRPKAPRVAALPTARSFNEVVDVDTFHVVWRGKRRLIYSIMDECSRYEVGVVLRNEKAKAEIKALEKYWIQVFGTPKKLRFDLSGDHQSQKFQEYLATKGMKAAIVARDAHHMLGILERNHQVRRDQIQIYHNMHKEDNLKFVVRLTCEQRNRLRNIP